MPSLRFSFGAAAIAAGLFLAFLPLSAGTEEPPDLGDAVLGERARIDAGRELFQEQCSLCHGRSAYPGKAPRLQPARYSREFVYERVTNGFRDMPAWKDAFTEEELISIVAYVMSDRFSN